MLPLLLAVACQPDLPPPAPAAPAEETRRVTSLGEVVGTLGAGGSHAWLGLPFAWPPVGARRWRSPSPPAAWEGTLEATALGSPCPQLTNDLGGASAAEPQALPGLIGDEDCLYLNVWAPPDVAPGALPVMVWFHGGANLIGDGGFYDGGRLAAAHDVVVVTTNYRLGPMGWFMHPGLDGSDVERSGNFGNLDHRAALVWVWSHIEAFGGDPERVTVFGESAGGMNVMSLLTSPLGGDLFHGAIVQSGGLRTYTPAQASHRAGDAEPGHHNSSAEILLRLLVARGEATDRAGALAAADAMTPEAQLRWLRAAPLDDLFAAYLEGEGGTRGAFSYSMPKLIADGVVLSDDPLDEALAYAQDRVPVMLGTNRDEHTTFLAFDEEHVRFRFGKIPRLLDPPRYARLVEAGGRIWKLAGADAPARALAGAERDVFVYRFDWDEAPRIGRADLSRIVGAAHALEIPFVFGHWDLGALSRYLFDDDNRAGREALSDAMMSYWANFAHAGAPGSGRGGDLPPWPAIGPEGGAFLVFDTEAGGGIRASEGWPDWPALIGETADWSEADRCALAEWSTWLDWPPEGAPQVACGG